MSQIIIYDKFINHGHRPFLQRFIKKNLIDKQNSILSFFGTKTGNALDDILSFTKNTDFQHCHILTLDDCILDFYDKSKLSDLTEREIIITGTLYDYAYLSPIYFAPRLIKKENLIKAYTLIKLLKNGIINKVFIPDERIKEYKRFPIFRNRLEYLNDVPLIAKKDIKINYSKLYKHLKIYPNYPIFLLFGNQSKYKSYGTLYAALSDRFKNYHNKNRNRKINIIIAGRTTGNNQLNNIDNHYNIIRIDKEINDNLANLLFKISDCVIIPYNKDFHYSSGQYSLALLHKKTVIVPNHGLLAYRTKKINNGLLFNSESSKSLLKSIIIYANNMDNYKKQFTYNESPRSKIICTNRYISTLYRTFYQGK